MLTPSTAWLIGVAVAAALGLYYARSRTWTCLIPAVMAASFISPTWFKVTLGGLPVGVASFVAALSIAAHLVIQRVTPRGRLGFDLTGVDVVVAAMVLWGGFVDLHHDRGLATSFLATYSEWVFPYLAGRLALSHPRALAQSCPAVVGFGSLVGIAAITQCLTGDNLFEWVCPRDSRVALNEAAYRFGLFERANATTRHPIFLGVILLTLLPWYVACIQTARSTTHRVLSWVLLVIWAMGIVSTLSRGPVLGLAVIPLIWALSSHRLLLLAAALLSTIAVGWVAMNPQSLIEMTARTVGDTRGEVVTLNNGERVIFTGTRARIVIWMVYGPLVLDGGATGYGTVASKGFPPRGIPGLPPGPGDPSTVGDHRQQLAERFAAVWPRRRRALDRLFCGRGVDDAGSSTATLFCRRRTLADQRSLVWGNRRRRFRGAHDGLLGL